MAKIRPFMMFAILIVVLIGCEQKVVEKPLEPVPAPGALTIIEPRADSGVVHRPVVRGRVDRPAAVHVIVRPMAGGLYWVQPPVDVEANGEWSVQIYIGRSEAENNGERFKIMAVADPEQPLAEGDVLKAWPKARLHSQMIEVVKQ